MTYDDRTESKPRPFISSIYGHTLNLHQLKGLLKQSCFPHFNMYIFTTDEQFLLCGSHIKTKGMKEINCCP